MSGWKLQRHTHHPTVCHVGNSSTTPTFWQNVRLGTAAPPPPSSSMSGWEQQPHPPPSSSMSGWKQQTHPHLLAVCQVENSSPTPHLPAVCQVGNSNTTTAPGSMSEREQLHHPPPSGNMSGEQKRHPFYGQNVKRGQQRHPNVLAILRVAVTVLLRTGSLISVKSCNFYYKVRKSFNSVTVRIFSKTAYGH